MYKQKRRKKEEERRKKKERKKERKKKDEERKKETPQPSSLPSCFLYHEARVSPRYVTFSLSLASWFDSWNRNRQWFIFLLVVREAVSIESLVCFYRISSLFL